MKLDDIKKFILECESKNVVIPFGMTVVCDDFYEVVPVEMYSIRPIEYNFSNSKINIISKEE